MPLTDKLIKSITPKEKAVRYFDGNGLYLEVSPKGGRWWRLKYRYAGKEKRISLGTYPTVSLKEARERSIDAKRALEKGVDPSFQKRRVRADAEKTFEIVAREWLDTQKDAVTDKTQASNISRLERHVFPFIASASLKELTPPDILAICRRMEKVTTYSAHTVLGLCSRVFRYSVICGYIDSDPCRDLKGALKPHVGQSMAAITNPKDVRRLLLAIDAYNGNVATVCALKLAPILFVRPGELRKAEWVEFDFERAEWRIPGPKMKMREEHIVPLPRQALLILSELKQATGHSRYLFPSRRSTDRCMSDNTVLAALRYMGFEKEEMVGHGFRAMASTLLNEQGWPPDIIERQLAHKERNKVRSAYNRAMYMDERRKMLQAWADFLDSLRVGNGA